MRPDITWYNLLGAPADASPEDIQQAYDARAALLRPELLAGAPSKVVTAAVRAQGVIDAAQRVLSDSASRQRYDEAAGLWGSGGGLGQPPDSPAGSGLPDSDFAADNPGADVLRSLGALNLWLARHRDYQRRIPVPDVRGLFYDVFAEVVGRLDLHLTFVQLTEHPMQVEGLVVDQSPGPPAKLHRRGELTVQVWHPPAQATEGPPPGARLTGPPPS
jgi:curved DNA-binding protein CbpA